MLAYNSTFVIHKQLLSEPIYSIEEYFSHVNKDGNLIKEYTIDLDRFSYEMIS